MTPTLKLVGRWRRHENVDEDQLIYSIAPHGEFLPVSNLLMQNITYWASGIWSEDRDSQLKATIHLRKLVSSVFAPYTTVVVQLGVVPRVVTFLSRDDFPELQFMAAWVLTNIASGTSEDIKAVAESGAVPILIQLLTYATYDIRQVATWALRNVAEDSPKYRIFSPLSQCIEYKMMRKKMSQPSFEQSTLEVLERVVPSTNEEILIYACSALSCLSVDSDDKIQTIIDSGVIPHLIKLLFHLSPSVLISTLRTIGNIVTGDDEHTQTILDHQVPPCLLKLLTNNYKKSIKKEVCWIISNITSGNSMHIQAVIEAGIIQSLVLVLQTAEFEVKKEAVRGISNAISSGTHDQIKFMVSQSCIKPICDLLTCPDPKTITVCLEVLENILAVEIAIPNAILPGHVENAGDDEEEHDEIDSDDEDEDNEIVGEVEVNENQRGLKRKRD